MIFLAVNIFGNPRPTVYVLRSTPLKPADNEADRDLNNLY